MWDQCGTANLGPSFVLILLEKLNLLCLPSCSLIELCAWLPTLIFGAVEGTRDFIIGGMSKRLPSDAYRTMCIAPRPDFLRALEGISALRLAA